MFKKLNMKAVRIFSDTFPNLFASLVRQGILNEPRWVNLSIQMDGDDAEYLKDGHRNREWYCDYITNMPSPSVLEIGAGGMHDVRLLKSRGDLGKIDYHILDISKEVVENGRRLFPEVTFTSGSINKIPLPGNHFDVVYCRHVIEHQPEFETAMREMLRISRGVVIINLFRWTLNETWINRVKKFSNSYNIYELLNFMRQEAADLDYFILLKDDEPGVNKYEDASLIRADDHMLLVLYKNQVNTREALESSQINYRTHIIDKPYDSDPPTYSPKPHNFE